MPSEPAAGGAGQGALRDDVLRILSERIISGELPTGARVHERRVSTELGVSRVPVREAIITLAAQHLVVIRPRSGAFVAPQTRRDVAELFDVREALEPLVAAQAALNRTDDDLVLLEEARKGASEAAAHADADRGSRANADFHELLVRASRHGLLQSLMEPLSLRIRRMFVMTIVGHDAEIVDDHERVFEAVRDRDPEWAALVARRHVIRTRDRSLELFGDEG